MDMYSVKKLTNCKDAIANRLAATLDRSTTASPYIRPAGAYGAGSITGSRPSITSASN